MLGLSLPVLFAAGLLFGVDGNRIVAFALVHVVTLLVECYFVWITVRVARFRNLPLANTVVLVAMCFLPSLFVALILLASFQSTSAN